MAEGPTPPSAKGSNPIARLDATGIPMLVARLVLGFVFLSYGLEKVQDPVAFLKVLKTYDLLPLQPPELINSIAVSLPWIELLIGIAFLSGAGLRGAATAATGMLLVFTPAVLRLGISLIGSKPEFVGLCDVVADCGCGSGPLPICEKLVSNLGLLALSAWAFFSPSERFRGFVLKKDSTSENRTAGNPEEGH